MIGVVVGLMICLFFLIAGSIEPAEHGPTKDQQTIEALLAGEEVPIRDIVWVFGPHGPDRLRAAVSTEEYVELIHILRTNLKVSLDTDNLFDSTPVPVFYPQEKEVSDAE